LCNLVVDVTQDRDLTGAGCRVDHGARLRFGAELHYFRFAGAKGVQAWLLRKQIVLRDFNQEKRPATDGEECIGS
jgi:hypothetical protein